MFLNCTLKTEHVSVLNLMLAFPMRLMRECIGQLFWMCLQNVNPR